MHRYSIKGTNTIGEPTIEHELKCWPENFRAVLARDKTAEMRVNDRMFHVDDTLKLREWKPAGDYPQTREGSYTGREIVVKITHIVYGPNFGIRLGYAMLSIEVMEAVDAVETVVGVPA